MFRDGDRVRRRIANWHIARDEDFGERLACGALPRVLSGLVIEAHNLGHKRALIHERLLTRRAREGHGSRLSCGPALSE